MHCLSQPNHSMKMVNLITVVVLIGSTRRTNTYGLTHQTIHYRLIKQIDEDRKLNRCRFIQWIEKVSPKQKEKLKKFIETQTQHSIVDYIQAIRMLNFDWKSKRSEKKTKSGVRC